VEVAVSLVLDLSRQAYLAYYQDLQEELDQENLAELPAKDSTEDPRQQAEDLHIPKNSQGRLWDSTHHCKLLVSQPAPLDTH
jgi:hypothetical protein